MSIQPVPLRSFAGRLGPGGWIVPPALPDDCGPADEARPIPSLTELRESQEARSAARARRVIVP
jgi:hypothetical protein